MKTITSLLFSLLLTISVFAQEKPTTFKTVFKTETVTYNGSSNPNECMESVANGIRVKSGKNSYFFEMPWKVQDSLKKVIGDKEVEVEVAWYDEMEKGSHAVGVVMKISLEGELLYENK